MFADIMDERTVCAMKKLEIVIKPERLEELKAILTSCAINGMMVSSIMGFGNQKGYTKSYRGTTFTVNLLPKIKVETVVDDETAEIIVKLVTTKMATGDVGDGKIFVYDVVDAIRVRTAERGEKAL